MSNTADLREFLAYQRKRVAKGADVTRIPPKYSKLNGLWGEWSGADILGETDSDCPIQPRLEPEEVDIAQHAGLSMYIFLAFSTDLWDQYSDSKLKIQKGQRLLRGGLQLATEHMPQGPLLTIPMTNNIGFQNLAHVIIHAENAEPDLGRKGFQPDVVRVTEKISVSAVTAFRRRYNMLRKPGIAKLFGDELNLDTWIRDQEDHEGNYALSITGKGLFLPSEELPIRSEPLVEQDVVALFNQMLSSGLIRGVQLIASSQYKQYDGLFRVKMEQPFDKFVLGVENPLGVDEEISAGHGSVMSSVKVLEYKYNLDGLIEEIQQEIKSTTDISLLIAWELGNKWSQIFDMTSFLDGIHGHHRMIHGTTHRFTHSISGLAAFDAIILKDLVNYLRCPADEIQRQRALSEDTYEEEED
jgi:hypothetical protein